MYKRSHLRYGHAPGYTSVVYTEDGQFMITSGYDGDIRVWNGIDDDDPTTSCLGEFVITIAHTGSNLLAATDINNVQAYTFPDIEKDGTLLRFSAAITCICVRKPWIAAGSDDMKIKLKQQDNDEIFELIGHKGPVLSLDICNERKLLASVSGDGDLKIWSLTDFKQIKSFTEMPKVNTYEVAELFGTPTFEPTKGQFLAYAKGCELVVRNTTTWEVEFKLKDENDVEFTCCQFSSNGKYLAGGKRNGIISVFDFKKKKIVQSENPGLECKSITCLAWHPKNRNELAFCDNNGQLGMLFYEGTDSVGIEEEEAEEVENEDELISNNDLDLIRENEMNDLETPLFADEADSHDGRTDRQQFDEESTRSSIAKMPYVKTFKAQSAFQPGATPSHLEHRYMVWNHVGIITAHADSADGAIDVEFHDTSVHHALHISNYNQHNVASLSNTAVVLSATGATKLVCIALAAAGSKEWTITLPDCESVEAVAVSDKYVAVATNKQFLRIFTVLGTQREIITLPGQVVCMAAHKERILVCYHQAAPSETQQHIAGLLLHMQNMRLQVKQISIALPPERQLAWLGFSDCGSPAIFDNMGLLQLFSLRSNCWLPVCDTMKHSSCVSNNYFVISVSESEQKVCAVLCRAVTYPMTNPRPIMQELVMQLPVCDEEAEKSQLEETLVRASSFAVLQSEKLVKETAIKLFALACRNDLESRAKELIEMLGCPELLQLAVKYATKLGRIHLSDRLSALLPQLEEEAENNEVFNRNETETEIIQPTIVNSPSNNSQMRLAPKPMVARKEALKRFSASKRHSESSRESPAFSMRAASESADSENMESMSSKDFNNKLNTVNPFAMKRKRNELDGNNSPSSPLAVLEKFKYAKK